MLHAMVQDHRTYGPGEANFKGFYHIRGWWHLSYVTWAIYTHFRSHSPWKFRMDLPSGLLRCINIVDGWTPVHEYTISSPGEPTAHVSYKLLILVIFGSVL